MFGHHDDLGGKKTCQNDVDVIISKQTSGVRIESPVAGLSTLYIPSGVKSL